MSYSCGRLKITHDVELLILRIFIVSTRGIAENHTYYLPYKDKT